MTIYSRGIVNPAEIGSNHLMRNSEILRSGRVICRASGRPSRIVVMILGLALSSSSNSGSHYFCNIEPVFSINPLRLSLSVIEKSKRNGPIRDLRIFEYLTSGAVVLEWCQ